MFMIFSVFGRFYKKKEEKTAPGDIKSRIFMIFNVFGRFYKKKKEKTAPGDIKQFYYLSISSFFWGWGGVESFA